MISGLIERGKRVAANTTRVVMQQADATGRRREGQRRGGGVGLIVQMGQDTV